LIAIRPVLRNAFLRGRANPILPGETIYKQTGVKGLQEIRENGTTTMAICPSISDPEQGLRYFFAKIFS
jgi:hypothetical protein